MTKLALLLIVVISTSYVHSQNENYRLPTNVVPSNYNIKFIFGTGVFDGSIDTFTATLTITVEVKEFTQTIQLHSSPSIGIGSLVMFENILNVQRDDRIPIQTAQTLNSTTEILTISRLLGTEGFQPSSYDMDFAINGKISTTEMFGIYRSSYQEGSITKYLITTQFQPTFARRAFPCFDEPAFKATFSLSFGSIPDTYTVLTNTKITTVPLAFAETPKMSTYLVAFTISDFSCNPAVMVDNVESKICSKAEAAQQRNWADTAAPRLLEALNIYTTINYGDYLNKLAHVAIPDFAAGAMENWGLSTYREKILLYDPNESTARDKQITTTVLSHEIAHQWFGNLVTVQWWSELFLNEGFANYFEYFASHMVYPEWQLDRQYVVNTLQAALRIDEGNAMPLQNNDVASQTEVLLMFSTISYSKGGSVLRMVEHIMGPTKFKEGLAVYLTTYKFSNTVPDNLWDSLNTVIDRTYSNLPVTLNLNLVMENWVKRSGFPLLEVTVTNGAVTIKQKQFTTNGVESSVRWYVPISYTTSVDTNKFQSTNPQQWLTPADELNFNLPEGATWIILNNQQTGYYRVNYDAATWDLINLALKSINFSDIDELNRAGIVDDLFSLAKANILSYTRVFNIIDFLKQDVSYFPWTPAFTGFNYLLERVGLRSEIGQRMSTHILENMETLYQATVFENENVADHLFTLKQTLALKWACYLGHTDCIQKSKDLFAAYKLGNQQRPSPNLRSIVYCTAMRESTDDTDWETLWNAYTTSTEAEKDVWLSALGCTKNEIRLQELLEHSLTESVRSQDRFTIFQKVVNNPDGIGAARAFVTNRFEEISQQYQALNAISSILQLLASKVTTQTELQEFQTFVSSSLPQNYVTEGQRALTRATENVQWLLDNEEDLRTYYEIVVDPEITTGSNSPPDPEITTGSNSTPDPETTTQTTDAANNLSSRYVEIILLICISYVLF